MVFNSQQRIEIESVLKTALRRKFQNYKPESKHMPFHFHLLGNDRMALFSFIQSLNTTFGTSIFEPVALALAKTRFPKAEKQYFVGDEISANIQIEIQNIINDLTMGKASNKPAELNKILAKISGKTNKLKSTKVDLYLEDENKNIFLFDLKTVKPNSSEFKAYKRTLLEWCGVILTKNNQAKVQSFIAIPYNPYHPKPYERWTLKGMFDLENELKVAEEFWDFLGGVGTYSDLLDCFERVGIELRNEIDNYFIKYHK